MKIAHIFFLTAIVVMGTAATMSASTVVNVTVAGTAQPWNWTNGGLNAGFQFGLNDGTAPAIASTADGLSFTAGTSLTVTWLSGSVANNGQLPLTDANGNTGGTAANNQIDPSTGTYAPSKYMSPYPIYGQELVGTFADGSGSIVGNPFAIGDGPRTFTIPVGATRLQLGNNDTGYSDNVGSWVIQVSGTSVSAAPEPSTLMLICLAGPLLGAVRSYSSRRG